MVRRGLADRHCRQHRIAVSQAHIAAGYVGCRHRADKHWRLCRYIGQRRARRAIYDYTFGGMVDFQPTFLVGRPKRSDEIINPMKKGGTLSDTALLKLLKQDVLIQRRPILQLGRCPDPWRRHCGQRAR